MFVRRALSLHKYDKLAVILAHLSTQVAQTKDAQCSYQEAKPFKDIPGPKGLPYFGTYLNYRLGLFSINKYHETLQHLYKKYGSIVKETHCGHVVVHLFDPDYIQTVYKHEGKYPCIDPMLKAIKQYREERNLSPGLGVLNGEEWHRLRRNVQPLMLRPKEVALYLPSVDQVATDFISRLQSQSLVAREMDFKMEFLKWSLESASLILFSRRLGCLEPDGDAEALNYIRAERDVFASSNKLHFGLPWFRFFNTLTYKKFSNGQDYIHRVTKKYLDNALSEIHRLMERNNLQDGQYNFIRQLLFKRELKSKDLLAIVTSVMADGLGTTAYSAIFSVYCLARNLHVQEKLYQEICEKVPRSGPLTVDIINKITYLKACVKETFRCLPISSSVSRVMPSDIVINGYQIPAGTNMELNNMVLYKNPFYFSEPDRYLPERWLRDLDHHIHPYILIQFSHGPRVCLGQRFAEQQLYVVLIRIFQTFEVQWDHKHGDMGQMFEVLMIPDRPATFTFTRRQASVVA